MLEQEESNPKPVGDSASSGSDTFTLKNGRSHPVSLFTEGFLSNACTNFAELLGNSDALVEHAGDFVRAMYLPVAEVQAVLAKTKGNHVKVYYGVMDDMHGKHFIFMGPCDEPLPTSEPPVSASHQAVNFVSEAPQPVTLSVAVPECVAKIPPCPPINDQFIQLGS